jgi:uncharacterized membrane protein YeaQ/YmgE (transglycosylase-associated protein family)
MVSLIPAVLFLEPRGLLGWIVVGFIAGALATRVAGHRLGCLMSIVVGVAGAFVGAFLASLVGFNGDVGFFGEIVVAFIGAVVLLALIRLISRG